MLYNKIEQIHNNLDMSRYCGFVVQLVVQQIRNKSRQWILRLYRLRHRCAPVWQHSVVNSFIRLLIRGEKQARSCRFDDPTPAFFALLSRAVVSCIELRQPILGRFMEQAFFIRIIVVVNARKKLPVLALMHCLSRLVCLQTTVTNRKLKSPPDPFSFAPQPLTSGDAIGEKTTG